MRTNALELGVPGGRRAGPKRLVLTHIVRMGGTDEELLAGVRAGGFAGDVSIGRDLDRY